LFKSICVRVGWLCLCMSYMCLCVCVPACTEAWVGAQEAEAKRQQMASKYAADAQIADADRKFQLQKASYDREVNTERAKAALASELQQVRMDPFTTLALLLPLHGDRERDREREMTICRACPVFVLTVCPLRRCVCMNVCRYVRVHVCAFVCPQAKVQQDIQREQMEIMVVERTKQIEIEEQEIARRERELEANVKRPAEAARYRTETLADGERSVQSFPPKCTHKQTYMHTPMRACLG
jgi:hypothetical protein